MYVKLFEDLLHSSLWAEDTETRLVWITLLLMADADGLVRSTAPGISHCARVDLEATRKALSVFEATDRDSRTREHEGRRIERVDGGYVILNYQKYKELRDADSRREYMRTYMRDYRERKSPVNNVNPSKPQLAHTDTDTDTDKDIPQKTQSLLRIGHELFQSQWNEMAERAGLPTIRAMTKKRIAALRTRSHEKTWRESWMEALAMIPDSPFLCGSNAHGWRASADWFLRQDSPTRILEGQYATAPNAGKSPVKEEKKHKLWSAPAE